MGSAIEEREPAEPQSPECSKDSYLLLVVRPENEVLILQGNQRFYLPTIFIPKRQRVAEHLVAATKESYGLNTLCLFSTPPPDSFQDNVSRVCYAVMELLDGGRIADIRFAWTPIVEAMNLEFLQTHQREALQHVIATMANHKQEPAKPFGAPGWTKELFRWIQADVDLGPVELTGTFQQLCGGPNFSLLKLQTTGPDLWFKAVCEPNLHESEIAVCLAKLFPDFVPQVVGRRKDWNAWVMLGADGPTLDQIEHSAGWERAARDLAELQVKSIGASTELLNAGCKDLRAQTMLGSVDDFIKLVSVVMQEEMTNTDLISLTIALKESLEIWMSLDIPDTLGHGDFNPGNIVYTSPRCTFLDWAEAYVGPPSWTLEYLVAHAGRSGLSGKGIERQLKRTYAQVWNSILPKQTITKAEGLAPLLAVYAYTGSAQDWKEAIGNPEAEHTAYLRSLVRRMARMVQIQRKDFAGNC